jgi:hypothetical protein
MDDGALLPVTAPPLPSMDFAGLLKAGLAACQQFGSESWTDYNEHDPGVTMLEQLCYAITDLGYRASYPVADILARPPRIADASNSLYTGDRILTCAALTADDFSKLILGAARTDETMANIKSAWLTPSFHAGQVDILLEVYDPARETPGSDIAGNFDSCARTHELFTAHRNLGETLGGVRVASLQQVTVDADIEIAAGHVPEQVVADLLFALQDAMVPFVRFDSVGQLVRRQVPYERIYDGPLLAAGVIDDASLGPCLNGGDGPGTLPWAAAGNALYGAALAVDGVQTLGRYAIVAMSPLPVRPDRLLRLSPSVFERSGRWEGLGLSRQGEPVNVDWDHVWLLLGMRIESLNVPAQVASPEETAYATLAPGNWRDVANYVSIQRQFPQTYGIGEGGLMRHGLQPELDASQRAARLAQARQLKAYLLFFEQLLADCGAQLDGAARLFSLEPDLECSYFWQSLVDLQFGPPNIGELLRAGGWPPLPPAPSGDCVYVVHVKDSGHPELLFRSPEFPTLQQALLAEQEIIDFGKEPGHYHVHRLGSLEQFQLRIEAAGGERIAFGGQRYDSEQAARDRVAALVMLMWELAADPERRRQCVSIDCRGTRSIRLIDDAGRICLEADALTARGQDEWVEQLMRCGINAVNYRVERGRHGSYHVVLLCTQKSVLAEGRQEFGTYEQALEGIAQIVALVVSLCCNPQRQRQHIERLPHGPQPPPVDNDPGVAAYKRGMAALVGDDDPCLKRRHLFLDHLLARFGERFDTGALRRAAGAADGKRLERQLIRAKAAFLSRYVNPPGRGQDPSIVSYGLGGGRSCGDTAAGSAQRSGLAQRLALLLGFVETSDGRHHDNVYGGQVHVFEPLAMQPDLSDEDGASAWPDVVVVCVLDRDGIDPGPFRVLASRLAQENCPAHLVLRCHVLGREPAAGFHASHQQWAREPHLPGPLLDYLGRLHAEDGGSP